MSLHPFLVLRSQSISRVSTGFGAILAVAILLSQAGCETTDYSPLIVKEKLKELEEKVDSASAGPTDLGPRLESLERQLASVSRKAGAVDRLEKQIKQMREDNFTLVTEAVLATQLEAGRAVWNVNKESGLIDHVDLSTTRDNDLLKILKKFSNLKRVTLNGALVDAKTFTTLSKISTLERIDLEKAPVTVAGLKKLSKLKNLKFLQLFRSDVSDEGLAVIAKMDGLEQLRCGQTRVGDEGVVELANLKSLKAIDLSDCNRVSDAGLEALANCPNLEFLKVWGPQITNEGMASVAKMSELRVLGLNDTAVNDIGMIELAAMENLSEIHLFRAQVGDSGISFLAGLEKIRYLNLRDTKISDEGIQTLAQLPSIEKLDLSETNSPGITNAAGPHLAKLVNLKDLNLWSTEAGDKLVSDLTGLKKLTRLNLDKTKITNESIKTLAEMPQIDWLHIGSNEGVTDEAIELLIAMPNLKYLNISNTGISTDGFYRLDDALSPKGCLVVGP